MKKIDLKSKKVLFIDLDGTLIETASGETFPKSILDFKIKEDVWAKIKEWACGTKKPYICIVSNQGGIECGIFGEAATRAKLTYISEALREYIAISTNHEIVQHVFCPSNDKNNYYRKPNVGMLEQGLYRANPPYTYMKREMFMVGDASGLPGQFSDSDKKCAENFGIDYLDVAEFVKLNIQ